MTVCGGAAPRKRARGYAFARPTRPDDATAHTTPGNDNADPFAEALARFEERQASLLRVLLADLREARRLPRRRRAPRAVRHDDAAPVDDVTRARARELLTRHRRAPR